MRAAHVDSAMELRRRLEAGQGVGSGLREALERVPLEDQDAWVDAVFGLGVLPDDGPELPPGCVSYVPCAVASVLECIALARVEERDVFVDLGAGLGRTAALVHLLTGASTLGIEVQSALVAEARALERRLGLSRMTWLEGDVANHFTNLNGGSVFFLYCPFSGARLEALLARLEDLARVRPLRLCCVDLPVSPRPWLQLVGQVGAVTVHRSVASKPE